MSYKIKFKENFPRIWLITINYSEYSFLLLWDNKYYNHLLEIAQFIFKYINLFGVYLLVSFCLFCAFVSFCACFILNIVNVYTLKHGLYGKEKTYIQTRTTIQRLTTKISRTSRNWSGDNYIIDMINKDNIKFE